MNAKTFRTLIAAALIALIGAICVSIAGRPESEDSASANVLLFPQLREQVNDVSALALNGAGNKALVTLKRSADGWQVTERAGYPADIAKLREFLMKLADASVIETKTSNPKRYADLGVEDTAAADAKSVQVVLSGLKEPLKLIVGVFNGGGGGGTFVRREGEAQSLLVTGNLLAEKAPAAWIRKDLASIEADRVKEVSITGIDGKVLRVYKDTTSDANFKVADVPKGRELASDYVANSLGSGLTNLRIDDVAAAKDATAPEKAFKIHYLAFGGLAVDVVAWDAGGKNAIQLTASNDAAQLDADITAGQAMAKAAYDTQVATAKLKVVEAKGDDAAIEKAEADIAKPTSLVDKAKDTAQRQAAAASVVADLNKKFAGWTFFVPAYEFANFNKGMEELLKPLSGKADASKPAALKLPPKDASTITLPPSQGR